MQEPRRNRGESRPEQAARPDRGPRPEQAARPDRGPRTEQPARPDRGPPQDREPRRDRGPQGESRGSSARERVAAPAAGLSSIDTSWDDEAATNGDSTAAPTPAAAPDDDSPATAITLAADLPVEDDPDDLDPTTAILAETDVAGLALPVARVLGVRLEANGRTYWCDAGDGDYAIGDHVLVDGERGPRVATVTVAAVRRAVRERPSRRVTRRATGAERPGEPASDRAREVLTLAKQRAAALGLPVKVFRIEYSQAPGGGGRGGKLNLYFTTDERDRVDLRELVRDLGTTTGARIELRQVGARDEAKQVGGIGSCGQELCCTTWLPDFVPVSIKMAKDQGLVLNPTKVTGQCGRLKCCLVYEQATYAELRKGMPKLGKRVVTAQGEGRVVEVDVLRQRVRVGFGPGESVVFPSADVKPLFPAQGPGGRRPDGDDHGDDHATDDEPPTPPDAPPDDPP